MSTLIEGKYEVLGKIKEGGMGAIYKVRHLLLDEVRVIKVMKPQIEGDDDARKRFLQEARMATSLKHPNIASVLDFAIDDKNTFYMVMEYIDGINLSEYLAQEGIPPVQVSLEIGIQTLRALGFLHRNGIVHRDISPDNLMLTEDSEGRLQVKLIDLGVAKRIEGQGVTQVSGMFVGKLQYASPEQMGKLEAGEKIDGRSDIYSFGCVLYRTMTGRHAYVAEGIEQFLMAHILKPPRSFDDTDPEGLVPEPVRSAIMRSLRKSRNERFATAEEFAEELRRCQLGTAVASSLVEEAFVIAPVHPTGGTRERQTGVSSVEKQLQEVFPVSPAPGKHTTTGGTQATSVAAQASSTSRTVASGTQATNLLPGRGATPASPVSLPHEPAPPTFITSQPRQKPPIALWAGIGAAAVVLSIAGILFFRGRETVKGPEPVRPTPVATAPQGTLRLAITPWARLEAIVTDPAGTAADVPPADTPVRLFLPAGKYRAKLSYKGTSFEVPFEIRAGEVKNVEAEVPGFDVALAVRSYVP